MASQAKDLRLEPRLASLEFLEMHVHNYISNLPLALEKEVTSIKMHRNYCMCEISRSLWPCVKTMAQ